MNLENLLVGESPAIRKLRKDLPRLSAKRENILIAGERGTGKTTVARIIHDLSGLPAGPLVINPFSTTDQTLRDRLADLKSNPAVLLVEPEELSFLHQSMVARGIEALTGKKAPRVVATTRIDPAEIARSKKLLPDLARLLASFQVIGVPPLGQRTEDIPLLVERFMANACQTAGIRLKTIDINALDFLTRRTWKDNIRELKSVVEKAVMESAGETIELPVELVDEVSQLGDILSSISDRKRFSFDKSLSNLERTLITRALQSVNFNQSRAAEILNLTEANLRYRMKKFRIK